MITRQAGPDDGPALASLDRNNTAYPWSQEQYLTLCAGANPHRWALVAEAGGDGLQGFVACEQVLDEASILNIVVARASRGRGLGRALMAAALRRMSEAGVRRCHLEVRASNDVARRLYATLGFAETGLRRGYYRDSGSREDARVFSLRLDPDPDIPESETMNNSQ